MITRKFKIFHDHSQLSQAVWSAADNQNAAKASKIPGWHSGRITVISDQRTRDDHYIF